MRPITTLTCAILTSAALLLPTLATAQTKNEVSIALQPGFPYIGALVMQKQGLIEKHAAALGLKDFKVSWPRFNGGGAQTDAMLAGAVDICTPGAGHLLLLWDRTKGGVKGIAGISAQNLTLVTRNPAIKSLKDLGPNDKIALPTIKVSTQAVLLQMAAAKLYGPDQATKLDGNTVQLGHPDAMAALSNSRHEIASHFGAPPYSYLELKSNPGAHVVTDTTEILGEPLTIAQFFTTTKYADANPKAVQAIMDAAVEAGDFVRNNPADAVEIYKEAAKDPTDSKVLLEALNQPGVLEYGAAPHGTMKLAEHLFRTGVIKTMPKAWTDYYLPIAHGLKGS
jgi:NitT/TauT family transport system substrate-binding protein